MQGRYIIRWGHLRFGHHLIVSCVLLHNQVLMRRPLAIKTGKTLRSLDTIDKLFERAFAPRASISSADGPTPKRRSVDLSRRPAAVEPPSTAHDTLLDPPSLATPKMSLDPIWDEVRQTKERELAASPSKVKSLDKVMTRTVSEPTPAKPELPPPKKVVKRKSRQVVAENPRHSCELTSTHSVSFREAPDGRTVS